MSLPRSDTLRKAFEAADRPKQGSLGVWVDPDREKMTILDREVAHKPSEKTILIGEKTMYIYIYIIIIYIYSWTCFLSPIFSDSQPALDS